MSEYWKSQPRKFCEFCKCWITDNKPSVEFHERGKRHQENVKNKISDVMKKGTEAAKRKEKENDYMQRMEKAALEAFKKDLANDPELAKQYNVKVPEDEDAVYEGPQLPPEGLAPKDEGEWYEAMSDMGYPYFWNTVTGESVWVAPEKYVSLADQGLAPQPTTDEQATEDIPQPDQTPPKVDEIPLPPGVDQIPLPGEEPAQPSEPPPEESSSEDEEESKQDRSARGVYGTWARIQNKEEEIDLQLPKSDVTYDDVAIPIPKEEKLKFKEKRVTSLGTNKSGPVAFKKRKLGNNSKNVRRRNDQD